jgi:pyrroloquinoline quinone (PQQ) biosynthesis protein C
MISRQQISEAFDQVAREFADSASFQALLAGELSQEQVREFVRNVVRSHFQSPHFLAFLLSLLPTEEGGKLLKENMLEEMGLLGSDEKAHPELLLDLVRGIGFSKEEIEQLIRESREHIRLLLAQPMPFPTLREMGLALLLTVVAIEYFLSRYSSKIATALVDHYGVSKDHLEWFVLHGEVDIRHAEEGIDTVADYIAFHQVEDSRFEGVLRATFAQNVLRQRYFPADTMVGS